MKVELLISRASALGSQVPGDVVDVSDAEAKRLIEAGHAKPVRRVKPEIATPRRKSEKATK